jgi:hypothetical protein
MVDARVRYWDDAGVNCCQDVDGSLIPCREGNSWKPSIELSTGKILGWPAGTVAGVYYKVCDDSDYWLADSEGNKLYKWAGDYVPDRLLCVGRLHSDYIILNVLEDGRIAGWLPPVIDFEQWEQVAEEVSK